MAARSYNNNQLTIDQEHETKIASTSSCKRSRRGTEKRVISVPIKGLEGFRLKGDHMSAPPSDSWAWRKYGQKPIKGSPYPRGYYRCSSSKGCPARKQVERSRSDPDLLIVTYSCEHNHSSPAFNSRNHHNRNFIATTSSVSEEDDDEEEEYEEEEEVEDEEKKPVINKEEFDTNNNQESQEQVPEHKFISLSCADQAADSDQFGWFDFEPTLCCTVLDHCPILIEEKCNYSTDNEMAMIFTMREEDESLFADLGELPECSDCFPA